jgi:GMP synthase-like glutamine amidotransferase
MILVVDLNWKKDSLGYYEFVLPILGVIEPNCECKVKHYRDLTPQDVDQCGKVILSGTALKDNAFMAEPEKFRWLTQTQKPVLGICAGAEAMGMAFGVPLVPCVEIGMTKICTLMGNPLFSGDFEAYSLHSYCVDASEDFEVWAKSSKCIQAIKHKQSPLYGVLFHPEVRNPQVLKRFIALNP